MNKVQHLIAVIVNPIIGLSFNLYNLKNKRYCYFVFFLFCFWYGYNISINNVWDISRHYEIYETIFKMNEKNFQFYIKYLAKEPGIYYIYRIMNKINMPKNLIGSVVVIAQYFIPLILILDKKIKNKILIYLVSTFLLIPHYIFTGVRFLLAISIFALGINYYVKKQKIKYLYLLAPLIHISLVIPVVLFFIVTFFKKNKIAYLFEIFFILLVIFNGIVNQILNAFNLEKVARALNGYSNGKWGKIENLSFLHYEMIFVLILLVLYFMVKYEIKGESQNKIKLFCVFNIINSLIFSLSIPVMFERIFRAGWGAYILVLIIIFQQNRVKKLDKFLLIGMTIFSLFYSSLYYKQLFDITLLNKTIFYYSENRVYEGKNIIESINIYKYDEK